MHAYIAVPYVIVHCTTTRGTAWSAFLATWTTKGGLVDTAALHDLSAALATVSATLWVIVFALLTLSGGMFAKRNGRAAASFASLFSTRYLYWLLASSELTAVCFQTALLGSLLLLVPGLPAKALGYFAVLTLAVNAFLTVYRNWLPKVMSREEARLHDDLKAALNEFQRQGADLDSRSEALDAAADVFQEFESKPPAEQRATLRETSISFVNALSAITAEGDADALPAGATKKQIVNALKKTWERFTSANADIRARNTQLREKMTPILSDYERFNESEKLLNTHVSEGQRNAVRYILFLISLRMVVAPSAMMLILLIGAALVLGIIVSVRTGFGIASAAARSL